MEILNSLCNFTLFFLFGTFCCFRSVHTQEFTCEAHNDYQNYIANSVCEIPVAIGGFYPIAVPNFVTQSNELMQAYFNPTFDECCKYFFFILLKIKNNGQTENNRFFKKVALLSEFGLTNKTAAMLNPTCNTAIVRFCCYWNLRKCFSQSGGQINLPYSVCRSECLLAQQACGVIFTYSDGSNLNLL